MLAVEAEQAAAEDRADEPARGRRCRANWPGRYRQWTSKSVEPERARRQAVRLCQLERGVRAELRALGDGPDRRRPLGLRSARSRCDGRQAAHRQGHLRARAGRRSRSRRRRSGTGLIGEYGWDHNTLYILEKDGKLHALIEWFFLYPLAGGVARTSSSSPTFGLYHGEKLIFTRDKDGRATQVEAARRRLRAAAASTARTARRSRSSRCGPSTSCDARPLAAKPPEEKGDFRKPDLVDLTTLDPTIKLDIRYATDNNFLSTPLYTSAKAFMQRPAAEALARVHKKLAEQGYGLLIHDAYRPWYVTKMFWDATPEKQRIFVADPSKGSRHNRGCAVDLTLYDLQDRQAGRDGRRLRRDSRTAPIPTTPAAPRCSAGTATCCGARWRRRASPSTRRSGGTSTTRTGGSTPS